MGYLSHAEFEEIRAVFNETIETFAKKEIIYLKQDVVLNRFMKDEKNDNNFSNIDLEGLVVWNKDSEEIVSDRTGSKDIADGYILVSVDKLEEQGLFENGELKTDSVKDEVEFEGVRYYVIGVAILGQWEDKEVVCRIYFKEKVKTK